MLHLESRSGALALRLPLGWRCLPLAMLLAGAPTLSAAADAEIAATRKASLNDTGLTQCVVYDDKLGYIFTPDCAGTGHDGEFGRDVSAAGNGNGHAGFNFEKIGASGEVLPRSATSWVCVRDKVTGSMWEVKTRDGSLRDMTARFTNLGNGLAGDASAYVAAVNAAGLCGATDWRLPTRRDVEGLIDFSVPAGGPMIDAAWFPNSAADFHWTSTSAAVNGGSANYKWAVNHYAGDSIWYSGEYGQFAVRLVRLGKAIPAERWVARDAEVKDRSTGLVWRRCAEGQSWTGSTCSGTAVSYLTNTDAFDRAKAQANSSGKAWRVPNLKELASIVDTQVNRPAIDAVNFPAFQSGIYHSATHWTENRVYTWRVNFAEGTVMRDHWGGRLLLVRDAQ